MNDVNDALAIARRSAELMLAADNCSRALGIEIEIPAAGNAVATMQVRPDMVNGFGVCHGGIVFTLADTAFACNASGEETLSVSANIDWLAPAREGDVLTARAGEEARQGRHGYYTVRVEDARGELVALFHGHAVGTGRRLDSK